MVKKFVINKVKALKDSVRAIRLQLKKTDQNKKLPINSDEESSLVAGVVLLSRRLRESILEVLH